MQRTAGPECPIGSVMRASLDLSSTIEIEAIVYYGAAGKTDIDQPLPTNLDLWVAPVTPSAARPERNKRPQGFTFLYLHLR
jgi:hypothetical protein